MKGQSFTTPEGSIVTVAEFDEANKIVMLTDGVQNKWVDEKDYSLWQPLPNIYIPDIPSQLNTEENAISQFETSSVFQHPQEGVGEQGSERERVEPSIEGDETSEEGKIESEEKIVKSKKKNKNDTAD